MSVRTQSREQVVERTWVLGQRDDDADRDEEFGLEDEPDEDAGLPGELTGDDARAVSDELAGEPEPAFEPEDDEDLGMGLDEAEGLDAEDLEAGGLDLPEELEVGDEEDADWASNSEPDLGLDGTDDTLIGDDAEESLDGTEPDEGSQLFDDEDVGDLPELDLGDGEEGFAGDDDLMSETDPLPPLDQNTDDEEGPEDEPPPPLADAARRAGRGDDA